MANVWVNSLAPGGFENIFQNIFFKLISWIDTLSNSCETALRSMPQNPSDDKSTLVQVMAWCRQAASHYLSQCCPRSLSPYGVTRPQWVNELGHNWLGSKPLPEPIVSCQREHYRQTLKHFDGKTQNQFLKNTIYKYLLNVRHSMQAKCFKAFVHENNCPINFLWSSKFIVHKHQQCRWSLSFFTEELYAC